MKNIILSEHQIHAKNKEKKKGKHTLKEKTYYVCNNVCKT